MIPGSFSSISNMLESEKEINAEMDYKDIIGIAEGPYKDNVLASLEWKTQQLVFAYFYYIKRNMVRK